MGKIRLNRLTKRPLSPQAKHSLYSFYKAKAVKNKLAVHLLSGSLHYCIQTYSTHKYIWTAVCSNSLKPGTLLTKLTQKYKFCHHLFTVVLFQTCAFFLQNTKYMIKKHPNNIKIELLDENLDLKNLKRK